MNILIVGTGVIGTIYGWALKEAGVNVTHLVKTSKPELSGQGAKIDILDERKGFKKYNQTVYRISITDTLPDNSNYDLVIVPTNWYQTESVLKSIVTKCSDSFFYILTSNWTGTEIFDNILDRSKYILGYPDGGGTIKNGVYWTNIGPEIHIAKPEPANQNGFNLIKEAFSKSKIKLDIQENMLHWLWVHNAGSAAISLAFQKYTNTEKYLTDKKLLKLSFLATRECLELCEKRGAYSDKYPEISAFKWPMWLLIPFFKFNFRHNESMKRYTAHGESMPMDDISCNYYDILNTAKEFNFEMPYYKALEEILLNYKR
ncbi:MAG: 2-dehydropantoate 2-reductase N-terminal domain-containing protein [Bacteroidales bacterium]